MMLRTFPLALLMAFGLSAGEEQPAALLQLRIAPGETFRYVWALDSANNSTGQEDGKPLKLHIDKTIRVHVLLTGEEPPKGEDVLSALLRFEKLAMQENRRVGDASSTTLQIDRQNIVRCASCSLRVSSKMSLVRNTLNQPSAEGSHTTPP